MQVALLHTKISVRADYLLDCFAAGLAQHGDKFFHVRKLKHIDKLKDADVAFQICYHNKNHAGRDVDLLRMAIPAWAADTDRRVLTLDSACVKGQAEAEIAGVSKKGRGFKRDQKAHFAGWDAKIYYAIGYDGLKRSADYCAPEPGSERWDKIGGVVKPWVTDGEHILLIGQKFQGASSQDIDIRSWYRESALEIRRHTRRPIVIRLHPLDSLIAAGKDRRVKEEDRIRKMLDGITDWRVSRNPLITADLDRAWATVVFASNAGVDSALAGVPVFTTNPMCMAYDVANKNLNLLEDPWRPDRDAWCRWLGYTQWNCAEMRSGKCWKHLRPHATWR